MPTPTSGRVKIGMIHGRFQPFHTGHREYLLGALARCETLLIGITNPDPTATRPEASSGHRHLPDANPFTYFERMAMIRELLLDERIALERALFTPFPIHDPDRWRYYVPDGVVHYVRVFSAWEQEKVERLRSRGYAVEVLDAGAPKGVSGTAVRALLASGGPWQRLVPPGVARMAERTRRFSEGRGV